MSNNLDLNYVRKTFGEDNYGKHALREPGGHGDVAHIDGVHVHGTRLRNDYKPRHAQNARHALDAACQNALDLANAYIRALGRAVR